VVVVSQQRKGLLRFPAKKREKLHPSVPLLPGKKALKGVLAESDDETKTPLARSLVSTGVVAWLEETRAHTASAGASASASAPLLLQE